ncbi:hypothetical protein Acr_20g0009340 [Actinidia rufa]|uniref:Uncharacterized protein n=1 Tax=Actinidia rufa TaxID=165716 RepID=A0A7J0GE85_9ERIC|nr:hypothetical protein Acr_20g0009340 [Actinidia rufa]
MARLLTPTVAPPVAYRSTDEACQFSKQISHNHSPRRRLTVGSAFPTRSGRVSDEIGASFRRASEEEAPIRGISEYLVSLNNVKAREFVDLFCKVLGVYEVSSNEWVILLWDGTDVPPLSLNTKKLTERLSLWGRVPMSSYDISNYLTALAVTDYEIAKFATLMDLLTFSKDKGRFKCVVRIVAMCPWQAKDFRSPAGLYRIRVTLEDPTARIHALLCAEDAEMFFGGYPSVEELGAKMKKLLGVTEDEDSPRNPPWMQCCIEIHSSNEAGASGSRHYHIRFTKLVL